MVNLAQLDALPLHTTEIKGATRNEPILRKVMGYMKRGWPDKVAECLLPYSRRRNELRVEGGCMHPVGVESDDSNKAKGKRHGRAARRTPRCGPDEGPGAKPCLVAEDGWRN